MRGGRLPSVLAVAVAGVMCAALSAVAELRLSFRDGRVDLVAHDVTLRQILAEWERVGGTRIVAPSRVPDTLLTLEFVDVPETQALDTLMRVTAGYIATQRVGDPAGPSRYSSIIVMAGVPGPVANGPAGVPLPPGRSTVADRRPAYQDRFASDDTSSAGADSRDRPDVTDPGGADSEAGVRSLPPPIPVGIGMPPPAQRLPSGQSSGEGDQASGQDSASTKSTAATTVRTPSVTNSAATPGTVIPEAPSPYVPGGAKPPLPPRKPPGF